MPRGQGQGRGRGRGRGQRGKLSSNSLPQDKASTTTRIHSNGSAEIRFRANPTTSSETHSNHKDPPTTEIQIPDRLTLQTINEEPVTAEDSNNGNTGNVLPIPDSPSNPFVDNQNSNGTSQGPSPSSPASSHRGIFPDDTSTSTTSPVSSIRGSHRISSSPHSPRRRRSTADRQARQVNQPVPTANAHAAARPKKKAARDVWTFFKDMNEGRICVFCEHQHSINDSHSVFVFGPETGTSSLRAHLFNNHIDLWVDGCDKFKIPITAENAKGPVAHYRASKGQSGSLSQPSSDRPDDIREFSYETFVDAITQFIIADDQSLNVIESPHLRRIFMLLRKDLKDSDIPHRTAIRSHIKVIWDEYLNQLEDDLKSALGKISVTTDLWSDPNLSPFMAVTAHWIETVVHDTSQGTQYELKLCAELIGFHRVPGRHSGEHLAQALLYILDRLSITEKIGWITMDNASNNDTLMVSLEHELSARGISFDRIENRIRCFPHIVNLACKAVISALAQTAYVECQPEVWSQEDPIASLRSLIRAVRASSLRRQHFAQVSQRYGLDLQPLRDVDTRWSSTLYMIERALLLEQPLDAVARSSEFGDELSRFSLSQEEWDALAIVREILLVPEAFQQKLSSEKTPTLCNALPSFDAMVQIWQEQQESFQEPFATVIQNGIDKLDTYRESIELVPAYTIAMLLNPSMKLQHIPISKHNDAKSLLQRTLLPYYEKRTRGTQDNLTGIEADTCHVVGPDLQLANPTRNRLHATNYTPHRSRAIRGRSLRDSIVHRTADDILRLGKANPPERISLDVEIERYLHDTSTGISSILYWQENQLRYPTFFLAALDYLPIQGSAVPCERVFSSAKETMTDRRNRIQEDLMEMLQMLKFHLKSGIQLDFSKGISRLDVITYVESVMDAETAIPEDLSAFMQSLMSTVQ